MNTQHGASAAAPKKIDSTIPVHMKLPTRDLACAVFRQGTGSFTKDKDLSEQVNDWLSTQCEDDQLMIVGWLQSECEHTVTLTLFYQYQ